MWRCYNTCYKKSRNASTQRKPVKQMLLEHSLVVNLPQKFCNQALSIQFIASVRGRFQHESYFVADENNLNTEIMWCLNIVKSHYRFRSCHSLENLLSCMFPHSAITEKSSMRKDKARYLTIYGIFSGIQAETEKYN